MILISARYISNTAQHMADSRTLCLGYGLLALVPAIYACLRPSACRLPLILPFVAYMGFNGIAGLIYILGIPDIFWGSGTRQFSEVLMHAGIMLSAVYLSNQLLVAEKNDNIFPADQCGKLF